MELGGFFSGKPEGAEPVDRAAVLAQEFESCRPVLLARCRRLLNDRDMAMDAVSETWLKADRHIAQFDGRNWSGWFVRIAQRVCIDIIRSRSLVRWVQLEANSSVEEGETRLNNLIQIGKVLDSLPEDQRLCVKLFYIEGLTAKEVIQETGFSENKVKSCLQNGRRNFKRNWQRMSAPKDEK